MKAHVSDFTIKVPVHPFSLATHGKLVGVHASEPKEAKSKLVSPDEKHEPVLQFYIPESAALGESIPRDRMYTRGECEIANITKDQLTGVTSVTALPKEALEEAKKTDLPKNLMNVTIHSPEEADKMMFPLKDHQSFVFYPALKDPDDQKNHDIILELLKRGFAMCSIVNVQNHEGLYRLTVWRDRIVLVRQAYPEAINPHEAPEQASTATTAFVDKIAKRLTADLTPIDPDTYRDRIVAAKIAVKDAVENGEAIPEKEKAAAPVSNLDELAAFLDMED